MEFSSENVKGNVTIPFDYFVRLRDPGEMIQVHLEEELSNKVQRTRLPQRTHLSRRQSSPVV